MLLILPLGVLKKVYKISQEKNIANTAVHNKEKME